jgi:4-hydroxybenzoate polyprenyltransferase
MPFFKRLRITLEMIKFEHTVFALPFALLSAILAAGGWPEAPKLFWIVIAMVGARSAAMAFNRLADQKIDAENPRTKMRALPAGELTASFAVLFTVASAGLFVGAAWKLNALCFKLSVPVLAILFFYSCTKRFSSYSHLVLGFCLGMAPLGSWIAVRGDVRLTPVLLCAIVMLWTAGFDIIYACQDAEFDRRRGLHSLPAHVGVARSLRIAAACHGGTVLMLFALPWVYPWLGLVYISGIAAVALLTRASARRGQVGVGHGVPGERGGPGERGRCGSQEQDGEERKGSGADSHELLISRCDPPWAAGWPLSEARANWGVRPMQHRKRRHNRAYDWVMCADCRRTARLVTISFLSNYELFMFLGRLCPGG